nr:MAG TPA: hypothetical protein [Caudoviricetes sp.]
MEPGSGFTSSFVNIRTLDSRYFHRLLLLIYSYKLLNQA